MDEVERAPPFLGRGEKIGGAIVAARLRKAPLRPGDRAVHKVERRDIRAGRGEIFGVVAKAAADVEDAKPFQAARLKIDKGSSERVRREIGPGHAGRIILRQRIDRLEPGPAQGIGGQLSAALGGIERVKLRAGPRAPLGEARVERQLGHALSSSVAATGWRLFAGLKQLFPAPGLVLAPIGQREAPRFQLFPLRARLCQIILIGAVEGDDHARERCGVSREASSHCATSAPSTKKRSFAPFGVSAPVER